jgi:transcriptional regulator
MYLPKIHEETRLDVLHNLIRTHSLGTWVTAGEMELTVNHIPFLVDSSRGELGTIIGHVARANTIWRTSRSVQPDIIVFRGPQTYVTPSWYPSKHQHGKAVPTWNYAVVTVHGKPEFIEDRKWLYDHLEQLTETHESSQAVPWRIADAPQEFTEKLVSAIVGVRIPIQRIAGKWKTNQNRPQPDKMGVIAGLLSIGDENSVAMASLVREHLQP